MSDTGSEPRRVPYADEIDLVTYDLGTRRIRFYRGETEIDLIGNVSVLPAAGVTTARHFARIVAVFTGRHVGERALTDGLYAFTIR